MTREAIQHIIDRHVQALEDGVPSKNHAMLIGPTGCGKTHTIRQALDGRTDIPFICISAKAIAEEGWKGTSLHNIFSDLEPKMLERAIIYVDEIDKLYRDADNQNHAEGIQTTFLEFLDGGVKLVNQTNVNQRTRKVEEVNFDNVTFIFSGAFMSLWDDVKKNTIGFNNTSPQKEEEMKGIHERLCEYGFLKEFIYRIPLIVNIKPYTRAELKTIIQGNYEYYRLKYRFGVLIDEEKMLDFISEHPAGARSIQLYLAERDLEQYLSKQKQLRLNHQEDKNDWGDDFWDNYTGE